MGVAGAHATDVTNACRTGLFNIHTLAWDEELCALFDVPINMLPPVYPSVHRFGVCKSSSPVPAVPVCGILGDQQAALFGQTCFHPGDAKNTYGTGCFLLMNTGAAAVVSQHGLLTTIAYQIEGQPPIYALEGSVAMAGSVVNWLRSNLGLIKGSSEVEAVASSVSDTGGITFVPAFSGLFAPRWRTDARGILVGLTLHTKGAHIVRAALESVAFQSKELLDAMALDAIQVVDKHTYEAAPLRVDGMYTWSYNQRRMAHHNVPTHSPLLSSPFLSSPLLSFPLLSCVCL
jgi:glycerol kinase